MSREETSKLLRVLNIPFITEGHHHCRDGWLQLHCPFCSRNNYHLGLRASAAYFSCWRCGKLPLVPTLAKLSGRSWKDIEALVGDLPRYVETKKVHTGVLKLPKPLMPLSECPAHRKYLEGRGFDWEAIAEVWGVMGLGVHKDYAWRLFIPIHKDREVVSFTTRSIREKAVLRYRSASDLEEKLNHKDLLYGEDHCQHSIGIVEGPTDAWRIGLGATATCGTGFKRSQLLRMAKYARRVICFDPEPNAQKRARRLCEALAPFDGETYNVVLDSEDPGSATRREVKKIRSLLDG